MIALLTLLVLPPSLPDWPRFRGTDGRAVAPALDLPATIEEEHVRWRIALDGSGHSSPVVLGDRVVVTYVLDDAESPTRVVAAHGTSDGAELWRYEAELEVHGQHRLNSFAASTPAIGDGRVHLAWTSGESLWTLALDLESGRRLWRHEIGPYAAQHGSGTSPILVDGVLVIANEHESRDPDDDAALFGLNAADGELLWTRPREAVRAAYSTPAVRRLADGTAEILVASTAHGLSAIDPRDGAVRWQLADLFQERCVASPVIAGDVVYVCAGKGGGGVEAAAIRPPSGEAPPEVAWRGGRAMPYVPTGVSDGERLFLVNDGGIVSCVSAADGEERWRERVDGRFFGSPILAGDRLYVLNTDGVLLVLAAGDTFEVLGKTELGGPSQTTPAVAGGRLYLRTERQLWCVGPAE